MVHICESTLTRRLIEFENTESGSLTVSYRTFYLQQPVIDLILFFPVFVGVKLLLTESECVSGRGI